MTPRAPRTWSWRHVNRGRMVVQVVLALAAGGYASWYIYRTPFTWVLALFLVVSIGAEVWRTVRPPKKPQTGLGQVDDAGTDRSEGSSRG